MDAKKTYKQKLQKEYQVQEPMALYLSSSVDKNLVLNTLNTAFSSKILFSELLKRTGLTIQNLAQQIFEITPKTFIKYKNNEVKIPSRIAELAIEVNVLYALGNDLFGSNENFNLWLEKENPFFNHKKPIAFLNTSSGINLIYEELKGIEYGSNA